MDVDVPSIPLAPGRAMSAPTRRLLSWPAFNAVVLGAALLALVAMVTVNALVDPYEVFRLGLVRTGETANERFRKVDFLLAHPRRFDALLLGSSRTGLLDPEEADVLRPGRHYYNLGVFGGDARDARLMLEALRIGGMEIREVVVGIDLFPFIRPSRELTPAYRHHPAVTGEGPASFFGGYLLTPSPLHAAKKLWDARSVVPAITFDFEGTGRYRLPRFDAEIAEDAQRHALRVFGRRRAAQRTTAITWREEPFRDLEALARWLHERRVAAYWFIHPHHRLATAGYTPASLRDFERRASQAVGAAVSFLSRPEWSADDALWYEVNHYRPLLTRPILEEVFWRDRRPREEPSDSWVLVAPAR